MDREADSVSQNLKCTCDVICLAVDMYTAINDLRTNRP